MTPTPIAAGTYWLMAAYESTAYVGENRDRNTVYYQSYSPASAQLSSLRSIDGYRHDCYLVRYE